MPKFLLSSPLSPKQKTIWSMLARGFSIREIASNLCTTRQYVNQTKLTVEAKISAVLLDFAQANGLQVIRLCPKKGIILGYHPSLKLQSIITYTTRYGVKVWYWHNDPEKITEECFLMQTKTYLLEFAKEKGLKIKNTKVHPAKLASIIFSKLIPELKT